MKTPLYYFEWMDHWSLHDGGWKSEEEIEIGPAICKSVGWIVKEDRHGLLIASHLSPSDISHIFYLLKSCIVKKRRVRV